MLISVDPTSREPLFEQVASSVRGAIASEDLAVGDRLPSARDLAASLDINLHTVLRAYGLLRDEGLIELRRGRGAVVTGDAEGAELVDALDRVVDVARRLGITPDTVTIRLHERWTP